MIGSTCYSLTARSRRLSGLFCALSLLICGCSSVLPHRGMPLVQGTRGVDLDENSVALIRVRRKLSPPDHMSLSEITVVRLSDDAPFVHRVRPGGRMRLTEFKVGDDIESLASLSLPPGDYRISSMSWRGADTLTSLRLRLFFRLAPAEIAYLGRVNVRWTGSPDCEPAFGPAARKTCKVNREVDLEDDFNDGIEVFRDYHPFLLGYELRAASLGRSQ